MNTNLYTLSDAEELNRLHTTFGIPSPETRRSVAPGNLVKLIFNIQFIDDNEALESFVERMWVKVVTNNNGIYIGILDNDAYCTEKLASGHRVEFESKNIIAVYSEKHINKNSTYGKYAAILCFSLMTLITMSAYLIVYLLSLK